MCVCVCVCFRPDPMVPPFAAGGADLDPFGWVCLFLSCLNPLNLFMEFNLRHAFKHSPGFSLIGDLRMNSRPSQQRTALDYWRVSSWKRSFKLRCQSRRKDDKQKQLQTQNLSLVLTLIFYQLELFYCANTSFVLKYLPPGHFLNHRRLIWTPCFPICSFKYQLVKISHCNVEVEQNNQTQVFVESCPLITDWYF